MTNATIQEIEGIDDYWGPAFRSVYEGEGHAAFVEQLNERIKQHDKEIEKLCNFHYQGFIESIRELLQVRSHAEELHTEISNVDTSVKKTTQDICEKAEELIRARKVELNIASTIQKMELCLPLLVTYSKLKSQVKAKRYYPALKTLEHLEEYLLLRIGPYKWCEQISEDVPRLRQAIRDASMADLTHFLENIRRLSPQVGVLALKQTQEMMGRNLENIIKNRKEASTAGTSVISVCPHELVDFSPLHRCLHIHTELGVKNDFIAYYRAQRRHQARLVLIPQANLHESIQNVKSYIHAVLGFFILEEYLLSTGADLVSKDWLLDTWTMALEKVTNILRSNTSLITDPTLMLTIKHQIVLFINTLECYGLPADSLPTILEELSDHYTEVLMQRWVQLFRDLLDNSTFLPIEVESQDQFDGVMDNFPFEDEALEMQPFPKKFPFSSMVPAVYVQVKEFIYACVKYNGGLRLSAARRAAGARRSASLLLTRSYCGCLAAACRTLALPLTQLHQIIVDTKYLEDATVCLYEFINNITGADLVAVQTPGTMFQAARDEAEQQICEKLEKKIDEFLDLENYDWLLVESRGQASAFVSDMLSYLTGVLAALETLPQRARLAAAERAVSRIAERLLRLVLSPVVRAVSAGALHQLDLDVLQCEQFAASEPAGLPQPELLQHLAPLRQLLDLVTGWDWSSYLHDIGVEGGKYPLVSPKDAATLLEKLKEAEQKSSVFSVLKKNERDRRKLLDTVLKQLKQLQTQDGSI